MNKQRLPKQRFSLSGKAFLKLRSETGASIILTLLLFLVTAILSIVLMTAGTTTAGVVSGLSENDQRYYAVVSARDLLRSLIEDIPESVVKSTTSVTTSAYDGDGRLVDTDRSSSESYYLILGKRADEIRLEGTQSDLIASNRFDPTSSAIPSCAKSTIPANAAFHFFRHESISDRTLRICPFPGGTVSETAETSARQQLDPSGNLIFSVSNVKGAKYTQTMVFGPETEVIKKENPTETVTVSLPEGGYLVTDTKLQYEITTCCWRISDLY